MEIFFFPWGVWTNMVQPKEEEYRGGIKTNSTSNTCLGYCIPKTSPATPIICESVLPLSLWKWAFYPTQSRCKGTGKTHSLCGNLGLNVSTTLHPRFIGSAFPQNLPWGKASSASSWTFSRHDSATASSLFHPRLLLLRTKHRANVCNQNIHKNDGLITNKHIFISENCNSLSWKELSFNTYT
jgi:hypothetical protein